MNIKDRVTDVRMITGRDLRANPMNPRLHPRAQTDALAGLLEQIGDMGGLLAFDPQDGGGPMLLDGHARVSLDPDREWRVLMTDLSPEEARLVLATFDPVSAMAEQDNAIMAGLLDGLSSESAAVQEMLDRLGGGEESGTIKLIDLEADPPKLAWVLIGIPLANYGDIAGEIASIAQRENVVCSISAGDGT